MAKGYWINHVEDILDMEKFGKYLEKWNALVAAGVCKTIVMGPVGKTQLGKTDMKFAGVWEFETFEKAMAFQSSPEYQDAVKELGEDETKVVIRTSCVVGGE